VEELRADLADVKHMYREQIDMLVGQVFFSNSSHCCDRHVLPFSLIAPIDTAAIILPPEMASLVKAV